MKNLGCKIIFLLSMIFISSYVLAIDKLNKAITKKYSYEALGILENTQVAKNITTKHIFLAMKCLFDITDTKRHVECCRRDLPLLEQKKDFQITRKLLLICANSDDFVDIKSILMVLDSLIEKTELARMINYLYYKKELDELNIAKILNYHDKLFLQDNELNIWELNDIVVHLCDTGDYKNTLKIILKKHIKQYRTISFNSRQKKISKLKGSSKEVALAILGMDRKHFLTIHFRDIVNGAIPRINTPQIHFQKIINRINNLSNFVGFQILWPTNKHDRLISYEYWLNIMQKLWKLGDAFSAYAIGSMLMSYDVQYNINKDELSYKFDILSPLNNFKNYRAYQKEYEDKLLPAIPVLVHDIIVAWESSSLDDDSINLEAIKYIGRLREKFDKIFLFIHEANYYVNPILVEIFEKLPALPKGILSAIASLSENTTPVEFPLSINEWSFFHIKSWVKMQESIDRHDDFLISLIYDFNIFSGNDLLLIISSNLDNINIFFDTNKSSKYIEHSIINMNNLIFSLKDYFDKSDLINPQLAIFFIKNTKEVIEYLSLLNFK